MNYKFIKLEKLANEIKTINNNILFITSKFHSKKKYISKLVEKLKKTKTVSLYGNVSSGAPISDLNSIIN